MNKQQYIEFVSTYRDRKRYPHPSQFQVDLAFNGQQLLQGAAIDPIYYSVLKYPPPNLGVGVTYPTFSYAYGTLINGDNLPSENYIGITPVSSNNANVLSTVPLLSFQSSYIGDIIEIVEHVDTGVVIVEHEFRTIMDYVLLPDEYDIVTATVNPTDILEGSISINTSCDIDQFFNSFIVEFVITTDADLLGITRTIVLYRAYDTRIYFNQPIQGATITAGDTINIKIPKCVIKLDRPFSIGALPTIENNFDTDNYTRFRIRSSNYPTLINTFVSGTTTTFTLPVSAGTLDYRGYMLWITSNPIVFDSQFDSAAFISDGTTQVQGTFTLVDAGAFVDDFFNNMTLSVTSGLFAGYSYLITDWDQGTQTGTITPGWTSLVVGNTNPVNGDTFTIIQPVPDQYRYIYSYDVQTRTGVVNKFTYTNLLGITTNYSVSNTDTFEILKFHEDSVSNLDVAQSNLCYQNAQCFEIDLNSLTLPNVDIKTGYGGRITMYPYVYVEFKSATQRASINEFYSNNPHAQGVMFRALLTQDYNPNSATFVILDGHGMVQTLKFKPNDSFLFSVYLPNGELFITESDFFSPSAPNPLLQVSVCFSFKKV